MTDKERHQLASYVRRVAKRIELGEYSVIEVSLDTPVREIPSRSPGATDLMHTGDEVLTIRYTNVTQAERARKKLEAAG